LTKRAAAVKVYDHSFAVFEILTSFVSQIFLLISFYL